MKGQHKSELPIEKLYYSIGEVAEELGVASSAIRFYEERFGIQQHRSHITNKRSYTRSEIERLGTIVRLVTYLHLDCAIEIYKSGKSERFLSVVQPESFEGGTPMFIA